MIIGVAIDIPVSSIMISFLSLIVLIPLLFCSASIDATKIVDIDKPIPVNTINIVAGYTARLECDLQSTRADDSAYLVLWYIESEKQPIYSVDLRARSLDQAKHWKNERLATRAQFDTSVASTAAFLLVNVSASDANVYRCRVDFRHSPTRHVRYQLNVVQLPPVPVIYINGARQVSLIAGPYDENTDLSLICEVAGGGPDMGVSWYRNGRLVESRVEHRIHDYFYHLHLRSVSRSEHRVTFTCQLELDVQPPVPPVFRNVTLNIRLRPATVEILLPNPVLEAAKGQQLQCRTTGANPPALVTWWIGNKQLVDAEIAVSDEVNGTVSTLNLIPSMEDDGRILTCRAQTPSLPGGFTEDSWRMQVYYTPRTSIVLGRRLTADEIKEGDGIYLDCHVRANPTIHRLTWIHNGKTLNDTTNSKGDVFTSNYSLVIRHISRHTAGNYSCVAANRQGESTSPPLNLHIKYAPICRRSKPLIVIVSREQPATLNCQVEADPDNVKFHWTLSTGRETALVSREVSSDSGLSSILEYTPRRDADFGQLQCWASNDIGKQKEPCVFNIVKEGLPPIPTQCVMHSLSKGILEVKCRNGSATPRSPSAMDASVGHSPEGDEEDSDYSMSGSSNLYWLQLYNADTGVLLRNMSNKVSPHFNVSGIDPSTRVAAIITTTNRQGRSESVTLEGAVERAVGSRAANEPESSMTMAVVLAAPGALLIAIVGLAAILAFYHRQRKRNSLRHQQSVALAAAGSVQPLPGEIQDDDDFNRRPQLTNSAKNATNGKQPDIIKSKRESNGFDYQVSPSPIPSGNSEPVAHSSLVVVASGTGSGTGGGLGNCRGSVTTYSVQSAVVNDCDLNMQHKAGILRLHHNNLSNDPSERALREVRDQQPTKSSYVYR